MDSTGQIYGTSDMGTASGSEWTSVQWTSDVYAPWATVVFGCGEQPWRKIKVSVEIYDRETAALVNTVNLNLGDVDEDGLYRIPDEVPEFKLMPDNAQYVQYLQMSNNGRYDLCFVYTIKSLIEGAANIKQMKSFEYSNWVDWTGASEEPPRYIRWSSGGIENQDDFWVKAVSILPNAPETTPQIHFGTTSFPECFDDIVNYNITTRPLSDGSYELIFQCWYNTSNGLKGARVSSLPNADYVNASTVGRITVIQQVEYSGHPYTCRSERDCRFRPITWLHEFSSDVYSIEPQGGSTKNIIFSHAEQTADSINSPIPVTTPTRRLQNGDFKITITQGSGLVADYIDMGGVTYTGTQYTLPLTIINDLPESMRFKIEVDNATLMQEAELTDKPVARMDALYFVSIAAIHWFEGWSEDGRANFYGALTPENAYLAPVQNTTNTHDGNVMCVYLKFGDDADPIVSSAQLTVNTQYRDRWSTSIDTTPGTVTTDIGGTVYQDVPYDIVLKMKLTDTLDSKNLSSPTYYTGMTMTFMLTVPRISGGTFTKDFSFTLGPVIAIHNTAASGKFTNGTTEFEFSGARLKPQVGQKMVAQVRAHEWIDNGSGQAVMTWNTVTGEMIQGSTNTAHHAVSVIWTYDGTTINNHTPKESVPTDELLPSELSDPHAGVYTYNVDRQNTNFKIQEAASWTGNNGSRYYKDHGAWRVYV